MNNKKTLLKIDLLYLNDKDVLFWLAGTLVIDSLFRITPFGLDGLSALDYWTMIFSILMTIINLNSIVNNKYKI